MMPVRAHAHTYAHTHLRAHARKYTGTCAHALAHYTIHPVLHACFPPPTRFAQLKNFYGPLLAAVSATKSAYDALIAQHSPDGTRAGFQKAVRRAGGDCFGVARNSGDHTGWGRRASAPMLRS